MLSVQFQMGEAIISLIYENMATTRKLRRENELECLLAKAEWRLVVERSAIEDRQADVEDKGKQLQATLTRESDLVAQVKDIRKQLDLLKVLSTKMDTRAANAEEKMALLEQEMSKHLEDVVKQYKKRAFLDMDAAIACCSMFMAVFTSIDADFHNIDANFPLERLSCMKEYRRSRPGKR